MVKHHKYELVTQRVAVNGEYWKSLLPAVGGVIGLWMFIAGGMYFLYIGKDLNGWASIGTAGALILWGKKSK